MDIVEAESDGDAPQDAQDQEAPRKYEETFDMPFKVATIHDLQQRAYLRDSDGVPEWLWGRLHAWLGIAKESFKFLRDNLEGIKEFLRNLQVDEAELKYNPARILQEGRQWKDHTLESRAFLGVCLWSIRNKPLKDMMKQNALKLLQDMVGTAFRHGVEEGCTMGGMVIDKHGVLHYEALTLHLPGFVRGFDKLLAHCPGAEATWSKMKGAKWLDYCISTSPDYVSIADLVAFLAYLQAHPTITLRQQNPFLCLGKLVLSELVNMAGLWLDGLCTEPANEELKSLPILKSKHGNVTKAMDPVNRMLYLHKIRKHAVHRRTVGMTHDDLQPVQSKWSRYEHYLDAVLHAKALEENFGTQAKQLSISWDPGNYDGKQIAAAVAYFPGVNTAAYLLSQTLGKLMVSEIDDSLIQKARGKKLTRVGGFNELRGFDAILNHSLGYGLDEFRVPETLLARPLKPHEVRIRGKDGRVYIVDTKSNKATPEVGPNINLSELNIITSISDQGPLNMASLNFIQYSKGAHMAVCLWDPFHRAWNDIKTSAKRARCWRTILELTCMFNINYGPFNSSQWWQRKRALLEEFLASTTINSQLWNKYEGLIAHERRMVQPSDEDDREELLRQMGAIQNFVIKGPLVKLMRWFSFFQCCNFYQHDFYATKMVLETQGGFGDDHQDEEKDDTDIKEHKDDRAELAALKKRVGTFKLAPQLISTKKPCNQRHSAQCMQKHLDLSCTKS